jgi:hemerythrin-like domain-containing protein
LVREFIEDYHEKLEEGLLFPEFEKRNELVPLVKVLREQHKAGRAITEAILHEVDAKTLTLYPDGDFMKGCVAFIRMYRFHMAQEDTVLLPSLRKIMSAGQLAELGGIFEQEERRRFNVGGFEKVVGQMTAIEHTLGIQDLNKVTVKT